MVPRVAGSNPVFHPKQNLSNLFERFFVLQPLKIYFQKDVQTKNPTALKAWGFGLKAQHKKRDQRS